jgi:hypothetical protein
MKKITFKAAIVILVAASGSAFGAESPKCKQQTFEKSKIEICLVPGPAFQHDVYTLKADNVLIFALVDDYVEQIELTHTIPDGPALELPLSAQGEKTVKISGGCVPQSKDGAEVARVCNFSWGKKQIVKDVRFEFN